MEQNRQDMTQDSRRFRNALGCFATGVAVVPAQVEGYATTGFDCNPSVSSVSRDPPPILWRLDKKAGPLPVFGAARNFAVNVLREEDREISSHLARQGDHRLEGLRTRMGGNGCPSLDDALAHFEGVVEARHDAGDHIIMLGRVLHFDYVEQGRPLLYHRGGYQALAV